MEMLNLSYNNDDLLSPCTEELVKIATYHLLTTSTVLTCLVIYLKHGFDIITSIVKAKVI